MTALADLQYSREQDFVRPMIQVDGRWVKNMLPAYLVGRVSDPDSPVVHLLLLTSGPESLRPVCGTGDRWTHDNSTTTDPDRDVTCLRCRRALP